jgi:hypothetical protein
MQRVPKGHAMIGMRRSNRDTVKSKENKGELKRLEEQLKNAPTAG